jgi:hypothetical protein
VTSVILTGHAQKVRKTSMRPLQNGGSSWYDSLQGGWIQS